MKKSAVISFLLASVMALTSCGKKETNEIVIGGIFRLSGGVAVYGVECKNGIDLAIEEINAAGGVNGKNIVLISEDDEGNPDKTVNAYQKLTSKDGVKLIIGSLTSGCTQAITNRAQAQKVVQIAPAATAPAITDAGDFIFRTCYTDPFQGKVGGKFASEDLGAKTAAILYDTGNDYSVGLTENFEAAFTAAGGTIVSKEAYTTNDKDFNAQLTKIKSANPDVIYLPDYYNVVALISKQLRAQGINVPIIGADGWDGILGNAGDEVLNGFYSNHYAVDSTSASVQNFVKAFNAKYSKDPNAFAALGYDSVYLLKDAILKAGSADSVAVKDALASISGEYVTGNLSFDAKHNPVKSAVMLEIIKADDGSLKTVYKTTVNP
jgi:branched-chain amino acid transport system substrate-binding protein